jgi:hypothetical protein
LNFLLEDPDRLDHIDRNRSYDISDFGEVPHGLAGTKLLFEARIGESKYSEVEVSK